MDLNFIFAAKRGDVGIHIGEHIELPCQIATLIRRLLKINELLFFDRLLEYVSNIDGSAIIC